PRSKQELNYEEANSDDRAWRCRYAGHSHHFICARSADRWLSAGNGRRGRQSCRAGTSLLSRRKIIRWFRDFVSSADQAPQKDLYVSEASEEWLLILLTQLESTPGFRSPGAFFNY